MIRPRLFQIGLSNIGTDRQRNIELIKELSWIDLPIIYSDGSWAILGIEKAPLGDRALAVLESPAVEPLPRVPTNPTSTGSGTNFLPEFKPRPVAAPDPLLSRLFPKVPPRPSWAWPPSAWLSGVWMPGSLTTSWMWQPGPPSEAPETIRIASMSIGSPMMPWAKPPPWLLDISGTTVMAISMPPWPPLPPPDFRIPPGRSRFADQKNLEPPARFVRWADRLETVLPAGEVVRRCQATGAKPPPPGKIIRGCAHGAAGRCFVIRVDDPGVARHELAHCNGWHHE